ncbi:cupin domain-containing protein [Olivibacter sp. CPCC 100613]|uniref:cupin domain-containing protein n=1 Tax=Olivibacter sp. CPCC 100613 TaxID=3079931 RepID=UPI002FF92CFE
MKNLKKLAPLAIASIIVACNNTPSNNADVQVTENMPAESELLFEKGEQVNSPNFTGGTVWLKNLVNADSVNKTAVGSVTFEAGARTRWHSHPAGQIILAIDGAGYYQEDGKEKIVVRKGEVMKCPSDVPHWHGASAHTHFVQVAITGREKGETVWLEEVTDEEYNK